MPKVSTVAQASRLRRSRRLNLFGVLVLVVPWTALAAPRAVTVLEHFAGVHSAPEVAAARAREQTRLTSSRVIAPAEACADWVPAILRGFP